MSTSARKTKQSLTLDVLDAAPEPVGTDREPSRESWLTHATVVTSLVELEFSTAADVEELGFPSAGFERLTDEEAEEFDKIRRAGPPDWVNKL